MGYADAIADNIPVVQEGSRKGYAPPCHVCGESVFSMNYIRGMKYTCPDCKQYLAEAKLNSEASNQNKKLDVAVKRIKKVADIEPYKKAINTVQRKLHTPGWFQSTEEIMVALELIRNKVKAFHQVRVFNYSVDFVLPDLKIALEIDGPLHKIHGREKTESIRDEVIVQTLGADFEVIHISTEDINTNVTRLMTAIRTVKKCRQKKRRHCP